MNIASNKLDHSLEPVAGKLNPNTRMERSSSGIRKQKGIDVGIYMCQLLPTQRLRATQIKAIILESDGGINAPEYTMQMTNNTVSAQKATKPWKMRVLHTCIGNIWLSDPHLQRKRTTSLLFTLLRERIPNPEYIWMQIEIVSLNIIPKKFLAHTGGPNTDELTAQSSSCPNSDSKWYNIKSQTSLLRSHDSERELLLKGNDFVLSGICRKDCKACNKHNKFH